MAAPTTEDWEYAILDRLLAQGKLTAEFLMQQFDANIATGSAIPHEARPEFQRIFDLAANHNGLLTETCLLDLLRAKSAIDLSPELVEANKIVFSALKYLGNLPFGPKIDNTPDGLTFIQLSRALAWILPDHTRYMFVEDNFSRIRTPADHRRILFQGLASRHEEPLYDAGIARKLAARNAFDYGSDFCSDLLTMNYDDDGDEIFHDLLHVLYSSQDQDTNPGIAPARMNAFKALAKKFAVEHDPPILRTLGIPGDRFTAIVRLLLAMQFSPPTGEEAPVNLTDYTAAATSICHAFSDKDTLQENLVTYPSFDHGLHKLTPYLFDSVLQFLSLTFFGRSHGLLSAYLDRPAQLPASYPDTPTAACTENADGDESADAGAGAGVGAVRDGILTVPLAAQLASFLCWNFDYPSIRPLARFTPENLPEGGANGLINALMPPAGEAEPPVVMLFRVFDKVSEERAVFGVFTPAPDQDGPSIKDVSVPHTVGNHNCALFQLAPVHGVFSGTPDKAGWNVLDDKTVVFGELGAGVCLTVSLGTGSGSGIGQITVRQVLANIEEEDLDETRGWDREDGWLDAAKAKKQEEKQRWTFEPDGKRGDWFVDGKIELVEIWAGE